MSLERRIAFYRLSAKLAKVLNMDADNIRYILIRSKIDIDDLTD